MAERALEFDCSSPLGGRHWANCGATLGSISASPPWQKLRIFSDSKNIHFDGARTAMVVVHSLAHGNVMAAVFFHAFNRDDARAWTDVF